MQKQIVKRHLEQQASLVLEYKMKQQKLTEFCQENALVIANTLFQQHKRLLCTWTLPMVNTKIILIILMQPRMEKLYTVSKNKKKQRANCGSDHELLIAKVLPFRLKW